LVSCTNSDRYKYAGKTITDRAGTPDTAEFFNIAKNDMMKDTPTILWPQIILDHKCLLKGYIISAHETGHIILRTLAEGLKLPPNILTELHRLHPQSGDHIRMIRGPPRMSKDLSEIQTPGHTDFGTVTIMFNWLGGLQVWSEPDRGRSGFLNVIDPEQEGEWLWVVPRPDYAIVCLGDAAVKLTNGLLCSARHRVVPAPGLQGTIPRYAVVYFLRPEDKAILKCLKSPVIEPSEDGEEGIETAEWIAKQLKTLSKITKGPAK
jgi:isopenicillin N synthase-like dioxygenase